MPLRVSELLEVWCLVLLVPTRADHNVSLDNLDRQLPTHGLSGPSLNGLRPDMLCLAFTVRRFKLLVLMAESCCGGCELC